MNKQATVLLIIDGFGESTKKDGNAIINASKPNIDKLTKQSPYAILKASGVDVGLPEGTIGNSEAGYTNIGAGKVVEQNITKINQSIETGDFFSIEEFSKAIENCKKNNSKLHLMGLLSDGGIHSHERHLYALLELAKRKGLDEVYVHCFMDGRDSLPASGENYIQKLEEKMHEKDLGKIATIIGRYYSMDRNNNWDRIKKAYDAIVFGKGKHESSAIQAIEGSYQKEVFDEFVEPIVISNGSKPISTIDDGDSIIFFNFRADRARELSEAFTNPKFNKFETKKMKLNFISMTNYDNIINSKVAFKTHLMNNTLGEVISNKGLKQARISEFEKSCNTTLFFDGKLDKPLKNLDITITKSENLENKDIGILNITSKAIETIESREYDFILVDIDNLDILGHTGNIDLTEKAVETLDECIGKILDVIQKNGDILIITSDHGNIEEMIDYKTGEQLTSNTINQVPIFLFGIDKAKLKDGRLCDVAPTILDVMNIKKPEEMKGQSLLIRGHG